MSAMFPGEAGRFRVTVNGLPHSWLPYEGIHTLLGALPALIHPAPKDVAVIGLGSGETAWAVACRPETERVQVWEIAASQPRLLRQVSALDRYDSLRDLLSDRRMSILAADGRRALAREERRYDVIEVDALYLTSGGSGNLYSVEFFELCRSRLKPGGLVCSQKPGRRVGLTFAEALPHVLDFGTIVIGSESEIPIDVATWVARLRSPEVARALRPRDARGDRRRSSRAPSSARATRKRASASTATSSRATSSGLRRAGDGALDVAAARREHAGLRARAALQQRRRVAAAGARRSRRSSRTCGSRPRSAATRLRTAPLPHVDNAYTAVAALLGASRDEIAVVENATRAFDMAFYAFALRAGDRILCSRAEYASNYLALLQAARRSGAVIEVVPSEADGTISVSAPCARPRRASAPG